MRRLSTGRRLLLLIGVLTLRSQIARQPFGNIAFANSDAGAYAMTEVAIDQAWRAISELQDLAPAANQTRA